MTCICLDLRFTSIFAEFYRAIDDEAEVPDKLELSFRLNDKPVQLRLERSDSIPANPPVIVARDGHHTYWSSKQASVSVTPVEICCCSPEYILFRRS